MEKKKQRLILFIPLFLLVAGVVYFTVTRADLRPDFTYTHFPAIAGVSTVLLSSVRSSVPKDLSHFSNLFATSSADADKLNMRQLINDETKRKIDYLKNSLIEAGLEKIGYTPIPKQDTVDSTSVIQPCKPSPKDY